MPTHLKKRGEVWWLKLPIPRRFQHLYPTTDRAGNPTGKYRTHVEESLHTADLDEANERKHLRIAVHLEARRRRASSDGNSPALPAHVREALEWREALHLDTDGTDDTHASLARDRAYEIAEAVGDKEAREFYDHAANREPTLREAWTQWSAENEHDARTKLKDEQALREFLAFLKVHDTFPSAVSNQVARGFVRWLNTGAQSARGGPLAQATKHARIAPLRAFWSDYLEHHEIVPAGTNPWRAHRMTGKRKSTVDDPDQKRPYRDDEILAILNGPEMPERDGVRYPKRTLIELYALGFYTGARIEELCGRLLGDVDKIKGGYLLHIRRAKKDTGVRSIPILHPIPVAVLRERIGKRTDPKAQLFAEFIPGGPTRSLAWYPSKALGRYRDKIGLGTATDTHSTRRTLITRLIGKGLHERLVQFYVGHKPPGVTSGVYAKATDEGHRRIAREIHYPTSIERAFRKALGIK